MDADTVSRTLTTLVELVQDLRGKLDQQTEATKTVADRLESLEQLREEDILAQQAARSREDEDEEDETGGLMDEGGTGGPLPKSTIEATSGSRRSSFGGKSHDEMRHAMFREKKKEQPTVAPDANFKKMYILNSDSVMKTAIQHGGEEEHQT